MLPLLVVVGGVVVEGVVGVTSSRSLKHKPRTNIVLK